MMTKRIFLSSIACSILLAHAAFAQEAADAPPNEPPYTRVEDEFSTAHSQELQPGKPSTDSELNKLMEENSAAAAAVPMPPPEPAAAQEMPRPMVPVTRNEEPDGVLVQEQGKKSHFIHHPQAAKGLQLIDRDGAYYYKPETFSKNTQTSSFKVGSLQPGPNIVSADQQTDYGRMYGGTPIEALYDYEWKPLRQFGPLGVQLGFGFFTAQGAGRFGKIGLNEDVYGETTPHEQYTFYSIPLSAGGIYRFQYFDKQWAAPYISGGVTYNILAEMRDDGKAPSIVGSPAVYGAGGLMLNISRIDRETAFNLDAEYGIHTLWLNLEAREVQSLNKSLDLSGTLISLGITADY